MTKTHHGLNIKDKINYCNNIYREYLKKKAKKQVVYIKLQKLISTRDNDYNLHHANKVIHPTNSSKT